MIRFTDLLSRGYNESGHDVTVLRPSNRMSRRIADERLRKLISYFEQLIIFPIRVLLSQPRCDWLHVADHSDAQWLLWPLRATSRVITCHDLLAVRAARGEFTERQPRLSGRLYQRLVISGLRRATLIEADSDATLADVQRIVGPTKAVRIHIPLSPSMAYFAQTNLVSPLPHKYALVVSSSGWRKRRDHAVQVWLRLIAEPGWEDVRLAIVGPALTTGELDSVSADLRSRIFEFSGINDEELSRLYAGATVLLQVSKYEGFGWPIIEANAFGTPAICSDEPVFREVGRGNVFVSDNLERVDWSSITTWLDGPLARQDAILNADRFSMKKFSDLLEEVRLNATTNQNQRAQETMNS